MAMSKLDKVLLTFRERLLSGFSWSVLSAVMMQGSVLISTVLVARTVGIESFGAYAILVSTVMTASTVAQGCNGLVAAKYVAEFLKTDPAQVARVLKMCSTYTVGAGLAATGVVFLSAEPLAIQLLGKPEIVSSVRLISMSICFQMMVSFQYGALQGFGAFHKISVVSAIAGPVYVISTFAGAWFAQGPGAVAGFVLANAFRAAAFGYALRAECITHGVPNKVKLNLRYFWRIAQFALPASLAGFVTMPCQWAVMALISRQPDGLSLVAMFTVAHQIRLTVLQFPSLLNAVSFSVLSRLKEFKQANDFRRVFWANLTASLFFTILVVALLCLVAEQVLGLYGKNFVNGRWVVVILLFSVIPETLATGFYQLIQSAGRMWESLFLITIPRDVLYPLLAALFLADYGVPAAAVAYLVSSMFGFLATLLAVYWYANIYIAHHKFY